MVNLIVVSVKSDTVYGDLMVKLVWRLSVLFMEETSRRFWRERSQGYKVTFDAKFWRPFPQ